MKNCPEIETRRRVAEPPGRVGTPKNDVFSGREGASPPEMTKERIGPKSIFGQILSPRLKNSLVFGAKVVVATTLITWLVRSGLLEFGKLRLFTERPSLIALDLAFFSAASVLGGLRWRALLALASVRIPFRRVMQLQLTGMFFNTVIPGNVGGDVVKALYVARAQDPSKRTTLLLIVFVERLVGLAALLIVASVVTLLRGSQLSRDPHLSRLSMIVVALGALAVVGPLGFIGVMRIAGERLHRWTTGTTRFSVLLNQLVAAMRLLASGPASLGKALAFSMLIHVFAIGMFTVFARVLLDRDVAYSDIATVFPIGILTMVLPISPSGVGVGHAAFNWLFEQIGLTGNATGATVFNVYLIGQLTPCLLGVFPYLTLRSKGALSAQLEAEASGSDV